LRIITLFSGSGGNAALVCARGASVLVDCGRSARAFLRALDEAGEPLPDAVFVTHEHSDHISGLEMLSKKFALPVHMTEPTARRAILRGGWLERAAVVHGPLFTVEVGPLVVRSFIAPHDSAMNVGYVFEDAETGERAGVVTDLGAATPEVYAALCGCRSALIESNHDTAMLASGSYPAELKRRIASPRGHLCNDDCASLAVALAKSGATSLGLAHISRENNTPDAALGCVRGALYASGFADVCVVAAAPDRPTVITDGERESVAI
jgi:phosphoribosyl 1,2-cyclic phosphodiesterase